MTYPTLGGAHFAMEDSGKIHLVYWALTGWLEEELRYASGTGGPLTHELIDTSESIQDAKMVLEGTVPLIVYIRRGDSQQEDQISAARPADGSDWSIEDLTDSGRMGFYVDLLLDQRGIPHITYAERNGGDSFRPVLLVLWQGRTERLLLDETYQMVYSDLGLGIDAQGIPRMSYQASYPSDYLHVIEPAIP